MDHNLNYFDYLNQKNMDLKIGKELMFLLLILLK